MYVDDFKIGGDKRHLQNVLDLLRRDIHLEDAITLNQDVYLGMTQRGIDVQTEFVDQTRASFQKIMRVSHAAAQASKEKDELGAAERMIAKNATYYNTAAGTAPAVAPQRR